MAEYSDLINVEEFSKRETFNPQRGEVTFYCRNCKEIRKVERPNPKGYTFICTQCQSQEISIGTEAGLQERYKKK